MPICVHLLLCHDAEEDVAARIAAHRRAGDAVAVHVDARAAGMRRRLAQRFEGDGEVAFAPARACGWGEWSLVGATLDLMRLGRARFPLATHFALGSADCWPICSAEEMRDALAPGDRDWVEAQDFFASDWIATGLKAERLTRWHFFNERKNKRAFYAAVRAQRALGLTRALPRDLPMRIGSQWWLMRAGTVQAALDLWDRRPELERFFRRVWIPDECALQSVAAAVTPEGELTGAPPTWLAFSDYGQPVVFHAEHEALLRGAEGRFFARKIARGDGAFRRRLLSIYEGAETGRWVPAAVARQAAAVPAWEAQWGPGAAALPAGGEAAAGGAPPPDPPRAGPGPDPIRFYAGMRVRGRGGGRSGPRPWERGALGPARDAVAVICKKWHLAAHHAGAVGAAMGLPAFGPLFDEHAPAAEQARCPVGEEAGAALGGLDRGMEKRRRRPGLLLAALADAAGAEGAVFALDPASATVLKALEAEGTRVTALELGAPCSDAWLLGHAARIGLWSGAPPPAPLREELLRSLRAEIAAESRALAALGLARHARAGPGRAARLGPELQALLRLPGLQATALARALCAAE